jgi:hypothetical protein
MRLQDPVSGKNSGSVDQGAFCSGLLLEGGHTCFLQSTCEPKW